MHPTPCSDYLEDHIRYDLPSSSLLIGVFNKRPSYGVRHYRRFSPYIIHYLQRPSCGVRHYRRFIPYIIYYLKRPSCGVRHCGRFSPDIEKFNI